MRSAAKPEPGAPARRSVAGAEPSETAERILAAALEVFAMQGFDGTTTRAVATSAGANLGLIKYYFGSKEELWRAVVTRVFESLFATLAAEAPPRITSADDLRRLIRVFTDFSARHSDFVRMMNDEGKREGPRADWLVETHGRPLFEAGSAYLQQARDLGLVPEADMLHLYYIFLGATVMLFSQAPEVRRMTGIDPASSPEIARAHADALIALLLK